MSSSPAIETSNSRHSRIAGGCTPWARSALLLLLALLAVEASARTSSDDVPYDPSYAVEIPPIGPFYGIRLRGLGGAYTAVAEGAEGMLTSLASLANRRPDEAGYFHWTGTFSWVFPAAYLDVGNNGRGAPAGFTLIAGGFALRFGSLGFGFFIEGIGMADQAEPDRAVNMNRAVLGGGLGLFPAIAGSSAPASTRSGIASRCLTWMPPREAARI